MKALLAATSVLAMVVGASLPVQAAAPSNKEVVATYVTIAHAKFQDTLTAAKALKVAVDAMIANPTPETLAKARDAWKAARVPYMQTEVYRFGNPIVDDWEGKVNSWPLDEGLIDYVDTAKYGEESDENPYFRANVIANKSVKLGGKTINASKIDKKLLGKTLHGIDEIEANVATGYHAIEFLLWGQDLNGTGPGAGDRKVTDFDPKACTNGNCERRIQYLKTAVDLLIDDLAEMEKAWSAKGAAAAALTKGKPEKALVAMLTGMGSLSYGELAGERMKLGLMLHDPEEEQDCFSDNTHNSHYYDAVGIRSVFTGSYTRLDGSVISGPALKDILPATDAQELGTALETSVAKMQVLVDRANGGEAYDQMIAEGNVAGNAAVQAAIDSLLAQTKVIERATKTLGLDQIAFEGSDSLDNPSAVGK